MDEKELTEFLPMTIAEMKARKWDSIDILLVCGDAYVDLPSYGAAVIGRVLEHAGYRVGVVAQPDWKNPECLKLFGRPRIGCAVTAGNMDSMVCIYTAGRRMRHEDMYSPGGITGTRPPHASVVYTQLCKAAFPGIPVVLGGVEASLRRVAHYDYWQDKMRPSAIFDSKADILIYGMGERAVVESFDRLRDGKSLVGIRGTARCAGGKETESFTPGENDCILPSFEEVCSDKSAIMRSTVLVEREMNPWCGRRLIQKTGSRMVVIEPPQTPLTTAEFDEVCELPYVGRPHFKYKEKIPAFLAVQNSIPAVRGCPGGCAFCGLVSHQGRPIVSRSTESIIRSITKLSKQPYFHGTVTDIGGAAGNIFGHRPRNPELCKKCRRSSCMFPEHCPNYWADEEPLLDLLTRVSALPFVKKLFINSGIRLDLALMQKKLTERIIRYHVSGHVKVAPEHLDPRVLRLMRKGKDWEFPEFRKIFERVSAEAGKEQYLIPLFISNFPGCTEKEMRVVDDYLAKFHWSPQQVQDFIPLPMTMGAAMYCSGTEPDGTPIEVNRGLAERRVQRNMLRRKRNGPPEGKNGDGRPRNGSGGGYPHGPRRHDDNGRGHHRYGGPRGRG